MPPSLVSKPQNLFPLVIQPDANSNRLFGGFLKLEVPLNLPVFDRILHHKHS